MVLLGKLGHTLVFCHDLIARRFRPVLVLLGTVVGKAFVALSTACPTEVVVALLAKDMIATTVLLDGKLTTWTRPRVVENPFDTTIMAVVSMWFVFFRVGCFQINTW